MKVTVLKSQITRKRASCFPRLGSGRPALGTHDVTKGSYVGKGDIAIGAGQGSNPVRSLGRQFTGDKAAIAAAYAKQAKADRRAFVMQGAA